MAVTDIRGATVDATDAPSSSTPNAGLAIKTAVRAATTAAITLNGLQTVDGVALAAGDRVLVKNQADQTTNGIYNASTGNWALSSDFQNNTQLAKGLLALVTDGTTNGGVLYELTAANPITLGSSNLTFVPMNVPSGSTGTAIIFKTANYTVQPTDVGDFSLGGNAQFTFTFQASGNYSSSASWRINNTDKYTGANCGSRAKWITSQAGDFPSFWLYPGQSCRVFRQSGVLQVDRPTRWLVPVPLTLYANAAGITSANGVGPGSDANDGLAMGGALQLIQTGIGVVQGAMDFGGGTSRLATIQLGYGTDIAPIVYNESLSIFGPLVGGEDFTILGNAADPATCGILAIANNFTIQAKDQGIVTIKGVTLSQATSGFSLMLVGNTGTIDFGNVIFNNAASASHILVAQGGQVNAIAPYTIAGGAANHIFADGAGAIAIIDANVTISSAVTITDYANATLGGGIFFNGGLTFTNPGNVTGTQYTVTYNGVLQLAGNTLPGSAGSTSNGGVAQA